MRGGQRRRRRLSASVIEFNQGVDAGHRSPAITEQVKSTFEVTPEITMPDRGTLGAEYEKMIKTNRFYDRRSES